MKPQDFSKNRPNPLPNAHFPSTMGVQAYRQCLLERGNGTVILLPSYYRGTPPVQQLHSRQGQPLRYAAPPAGTLRRGCCARTHAELVSGAPPGE